MEKRIYRSLCAAVVAAVVLSVTFSTWVFYDFYADQARLGVTSRFADMAVATLPSVCFIIVLMLCGCMFIASQLTRSIVAPIEKLGDSLLMRRQDRFPLCYPELEPFVGKIYSLQQQLEEQRVTDYAEMLQLDSMRREFSANVSHELKTPLTSISGFAEMIENGMVQSPEDSRAFAARIVKESSRLITLVEDIMHLSRLDEELTLELHSCLPGEIAEEVMQYLYPVAQRQQVTLMLEGTAPAVNGNHVMLCELIQNLCENAIKYNHPGGSVWIKLFREGDNSVIQVVDNGIGIAPEHHDRIFQRFYRVDKSRSKQTGGTGLGLSICKHIAERHGGSISVASDIGEGSCFTVSLPALV